MRKRLRIGAVLCVFALLAAGGAGGAYWARASDSQAPAASSPHAPLDANADAAAVARGAQLAAIGDCIGCHTAERGAPLAGGRPMHTPFGVIYSTNITPDDATGIGGWPLAAFMRAMREGVSRDGHRLYPAFPYPHFTHMRDDDIAALYAWLMSRDAVAARVPPNALHFPFNIRALMAVWNRLYLEPGPSTNATAIAGAHENANANANAREIERGRYLVESVGHCGACHTPLNALGAERRERALQGGTIEGWDAPALTDLSTRPKPWTLDQLVVYLRNGVASEHGAAAGPMRPVTRLLADAPIDDVRAIAAYLLAAQTGARPAAGNVSATDLAPTDTAAVHGEGARLFTAACASCHGESAALTASGAIAPLAWSTTVNADSPRNMVRILLDGIGWDGSAATPFMPPFAQTFTDAQLAALANYTRARETARGPWPSLDARAVAHLRKENPPR